MAKSLDGPARKNLLRIAGAALLCVFATAASADTWQAGVARVRITPQQPMWLSGYAARSGPATGKLTDLWAKALVLKDHRDKHVVLVTMDLIGIDRELAREICRRAEREFQIPRSAIALSTSHTHTGPVVGNNLAAMYALDDQQQRFVDAYTADLVEKLIDVIRDAFGDLRPARLEFGNGNATFAVNRRNNPEGEVVERRAAGTLVGPVDHAVPVLAVLGSDDQLRAVAFGYACHATVLADNVWSGDWPGFAQLELEERHPEAIALFWAGCGADQNPLPRRAVELAQDYGRQAADAVDAVLAGPMQSLGSSVETGYEEIELAFAALPTRDQLEREAATDDYAGRRARMLLVQWERDGQLRNTYPYPIQVWRWGDELAWVFLGGEVVVDYSLRLKERHKSRPIWTAGYANDVMAYIPSERVLKEGGYEGGGAMVYYGLPAPWRAGLEEHIVGKCLEMVGSPTAATR
jgi:hypothetical protein